MEPPISPQPRRNSERFNAPDADVIIKSNDDVYFSLHRKYLEANTGGFPPMAIEPDGEVVELTEDSSTLDLLFQFVYPKRHPSLSNAPYEVVAPLAEAAEKYEVFSAMNICQIRMVNFLPEHAEGIMTYAAKHGYPEIVDKTAPLVVSLPIGDIVRLLPQHLVVPWVIYKQQWNDIFINALTSQPIIKRNATCVYCGSSRLREADCDSCCRSTVAQASERLSLNLSIPSLNSLATIAQQAKEEHSKFAEEIDSWQQNIQSQLDGIQKFSIFI